MTAKPRVDWWRVITDLAEHGHTTRKLAKCLGKPRGGISMLRNGGVSQPKHADGEELIELWMSATGKKREDVPRRMPSLSVSQAKR